MNNEHDGPLRKYRFGKDPSWGYQSDALNKAIRAFRIGALFPHQYVDKGDRIPTKTLSDKGWDETIYLSSKPGATIPVFVYVDKEFVEIARILPEGNEAQDFSMKALPESIQAQLQSVGTSTDLVAAQGSHHLPLDLGNASRSLIESKKLELQKLQGRLHQQMREIQSQVGALQEEVKKRLEQIWAIELFLGTKEQVVRLTEGAPAPAHTKIAVHQRTLCMDEEMAVWTWFNNPDQIGKFDHQNLEGFDQWLTQDPAHVDLFIPEPKGIAALRVRRRTKDRDLPTDMGEMLIRMAQEEADRKTYILIKNGENLYRIWADVKLWPRFFPRLTEFDWLQRNSKYDHRKAQEKMKHFVGGLLAIQGLIMRSDLLHPLPAEGIDIFRPDDVEEFFTLVRDDEDQLKLGTGDVLDRLTWRNYREYLREQVQVGARVLLVGRLGDSLYERTMIRSVGCWPDRKELYVIDKKHSGRYSGCNWSFLYLPDDTIYPSDYYSSSHKRERRVRFYVYSDEVVAFDAISWRAVEKLLHDRSQREFYASSFLTMFKWWNLRKKEQEREDPFIDLILSQAGVSRDNQDERARCERLIRWWKLKTKFARTISTDESKAVRMISKAFKNGKDHDEDPEKKFLETL